MRDVALPANLKSGYELLPAADEGAWATLARTAGGVPEVSAEWLRAHGYTPEGQERQS